MTKYKLIKLPDSTIVVSDEDINENDTILTIDLRVIEVSYLLSKDVENGQKIIAGLPNLPAIKYNLSDEDAKKIWYVDVEYIAKELAVNETCNDLKRNLIVKFFDLGFQKAMELNDKKFSEEDMRKALDYGANRATTLNKITEHDKNNFIEFISQPKIFDCEIEMTDYITVTKIL